MQLQVICIRTNMPRGFSLIEMLITLSLLGSIAGIALFVSLSSYTSENLISERDVLVGLLLQARTSSIEGVLGVDHGFCFDQAQREYVVFQSPFTSINTEKNVPKSPNSSLDSVHNCQSSGEVIFTALSGTTTPTTLSVSNSTQSLRIIINSEGMIEEL
jgi:prepilin-type N-terminal cleavage/methylation domain-containing protein